VSALSSLLESSQADESIAIIAALPLVNQEPAILDHMRQVEHALHALCLASEPTSPKVRRHEATSKDSRGTATTAFETLSAPKSVAWHQDVAGGSQSAEFSDHLFVSPARHMFEQMEQMRQRAVAGQQVRTMGEDYTRPPAPPSRAGSNTDWDKSKDLRVSIQESAVKERGPDKVRSTARESQQACGKETHADEVEEKEEEKMKKEQKRDPLEQTRSSESLRQLSAQFSSTIKKFTRKRSRADRSTPLEEGAEYDAEKRELEVTKSRADSKKKVNTNKDNESKLAEDACQWTPEEVGQWLENIGLAELVPLFVHQGIDGKALMRLHHGALSRAGLSTAVSTTLLQQRRKLITRPNSLTASPSESSMASANFSSSSSSSSSSVSTQYRDKIIKKIEASEREKEAQEEKKRKKKKSKKSKKNKKEKLKSSEEVKERTTKREQMKEVSDQLNEQTKKTKIKKKNKTKKKNKKNSKEEVSTSPREAANKIRRVKEETATPAKTNDPLVKRSGSLELSGDEVWVRKKKGKEKENEPRSNLNTTQEEQEDEEGPGSTDSKNKVASRRRKELRFEGGVPSEEDEDRSPPDLMGLHLGKKGKGEELLVLRDIQLSLQEERSKKDVIGPSALSANLDLESDSSQESMGDEDEDQHADHHHIASNVDLREERKEAAGRKPIPLALQKRTGFFGSLSGLFGTKEKKRRARSESTPLPVRRVEVEQAVENSEPVRATRSRRGSWLNPTQWFGAGRPRKADEPKDLIRRSKREDSSGSIGKGASRNGSRSASMGRLEERNRRRRLHKETVSRSDGSIVSGRKVSRKSAQSFLSRIAKRMSPAPTSSRLPTGFANDRRQRQEDDGIFAGRGCQLRLDHGHNHHPLTFARAWCQYLALFGSHACFSSHLYAM